MAFPSNCEWVLLFVELQVILCLPRKQKKTLVLNNSVLKIKMFQQLIKNEMISQLEFIL